MHDSYDTLGAGGTAAPAPPRRGTVLERAAREETPRFANLLDAVPQLVWTASVDGRFMYCNSDVRRRLGSCEGHAVEYIIPERLVHSDDRQRWLGMWRRAMQSGYPYEVEYRARSDSDGIAHWYLERGTPYTVEMMDGSSTTIITDQRDIREGDCVAIERVRETSNIRRAAANYCDAQNQRAVSSVADETSADALACERAKQALLDATPESADLAVRRVELLCNG